MDIREEQLWSLRASRGFVGPSCSQACASAPKGSTAIRWAHTAVRLATSPSTNLFRLKRNGDEAARKSQRGVAIDCPRAISDCSLHKIYATPRGRAPQRISGTGQVRQGVQDKRRSVAAAVGVLGRACRSRARVGATSPRAPKRCIGELCAHRTRNPHISRVNCKIATGAKINTPMHEVR